jgi:hypothetical protein
LDWASLRRFAFKCLFITLAVLPVAERVQKLSTDFFREFGGQALAVVTEGEHTKDYAAKESSARAPSVVTPAGATPGSSSDVLPADSSNSDHVLSGAIFKIDIPMTWQMTRARLIGSGASTLTESFRETWTLEVRASGASFLSSPRSKVRVYISGVKYPRFVAKKEKRRGEEALIAVEALGITERDFAELIGLPNTNRDHDAEQATDVNETLDASKLVTMNLSHRNSTDITLDLSDEEHFAIHLELGNSAPVY